MQLAAEAVEPFGDERADLRAAWMTRELIAIQCSEMSDTQHQEMFDRLYGYLKVNQPQERVLSPAEVARMMGR